ncbi:MAG: response regulator [Acaryochloridaceae cyanobacterium RU_4_10]|nr:response regulator [Acaryochloridaceae cyanobacterium RU_4_10]
MKILLVEDDEFIIALLTRSLSVHHYVVDVVKDGEMGWTYGSGFEYDLIVLDVMLPKLDGLTLCQRFRAEGLTVPILVLTAQNSSIAKVQGLNAGADDYVVKPFDPPELVARIQALLRRSSANPSPVLEWGALALNPSTCEVTYNAQPLLLTTKEYDLLELFLRDSHHVFGSDEILDRLWSSEEFPAEATVRSHMRRLRQKLQGLGAPQDFIGTIHGRGYYLKPIQSPISSSPERSSTKNLNSLPRPPIDNSDEQQYLNFLNDTWKETQLNCLEQLTVLSQSVQTLQTGSFELGLQQKAHQVAHKLAGTLGIFGFTQGTQISRRLEQILSGPQVLSLETAPLLATLTATLREEIQNAPPILAPQSYPENAPLFLIVDCNPRFWDPFIPLAAQQGLRIAIASTLEVAKTLLESTPTTTEDLASGVLIRLSSFQTQDKNLATETPWAWLQPLMSAHLNLPFLILSDRDNLGDRLAVLRQGGQFLLEQSVTPEQIVAHMIKSLPQTTVDTKIMVVDDDCTWLNTLPRLLEPWKFKVTTLADPQQFWTVLKSVCPDVLVLDVKMPQINGFELCQILRSDPHWQQLPVLFVSALDDDKTQNQAFTVGADDYLCKPVPGDRLANRILNRLQRMHSVQIATP